MPEQLGQRKQDQMSVSVIVAKSYVFCKIMEDRIESNHEQIEKKFYVSLFIAIYCYPYVFDQVSFLGLIQYYADVQPVVNTARSSTVCR